MAGTPFYAGQFSAVPPPPPPIPYSYPPDYRPPYSSMYQPTSAQTTFPPQGSYYLAAPTSDVPYQSTSSTTTTLPSSATTITSGASGTQLALPTPPHIPAAYYYSGYSYPYSAGRIIAPILALGVFPSVFFYFILIAQTGTIVICDTKYSLARSLRNHRNRQKCPLRL
jgi:hypothetical protein